ncbi:YbaB/EbfC family nucleoid-associated protein [Saccharothrix sp. SC076]|nr:YbaB/EbfC family nucleoid-associated protein [Saccharothrix obliqua]
MPEDIGASERMLDQWQAGIERKAERYQRMAEHVQGLSITETSKDGLVRLTIGSNGILTRLEIAEQAGGKRMAEVSAEVMRTLQRAQSRIPELLQQAMAETIGTGDETANVLLHEAKKHFPAPPQDDVPPPVNRELDFGLDDDGHREQTRRPQAPPTRRPPASRGPDDDDDFGGRSFLS